jgi:hypothetical protein
VRTKLLSLLALVVVVAACGGGGSGGSSSATTTRGEPSQEGSSPSGAGAEQVRWELTGEGWKAVGGTPPACADPIVLTTPVDLAKATSILYPGQVRGEYKPHGGFRFDGVPNEDIDVVSPITGVLYRGTRLLVGGELQYGIDIVSPCGIMVRLGHLLEAAPELVPVFDAMPPAVEGDSRTHLITPTFRVEAGDLLATAVGVRTGSNTFVDLGVYDLRQANEVSKDPAWAAAHAGELDRYAVCWFDLLSAADAARVRSLPAGDPAKGRSSDYCR